MKNVDISHPTSDQLAAFDHGQLSATEWEHVERHVTECHTCCRQLETVPDDILTALLKSSTKYSCTNGVPSDDVTHLRDLPAGLIGHPRYRILGMVGSGGMGTVFKAEHRLMERLVALKVLHRGLTNRPTAIDRFRQEVKAAARLSHPNIVVAFDADEAGGDHFLIMEFVEGESLDRLVASRGHLPVEQACELVRQAATGLQYAFEQGMVHRDLKPANLLLTPGGQVKILDFGLARFAAQTAGDSTDTPIGAIVGTPDYVAPEQALQGRDADIRADIYSLGCTLYHLLTGRPPFADGSILQKLMAHQDAMPRPVSAVRDDMPPGLVAVLDRMLAKDPAKRFQIPAEVVRALDPFTHGAPAPTVRARRRIQWLAVAGLGTTVLVAIVFVFGGTDSPRPLLPTAPPDRRLLPNEPKGDETKQPQAAEVKSRPSARQQLEDWLKREGAPGIERTLRPDVLRQHDSKVKPGMVFVACLSPDLARSGKPTFLAGRQDDFFVLHPDPFIQVAPGTMIFQTSAAQDHEFHPNPPVTLSFLTIENADQLDGFSDIRGNVAFANRDRIMGDLALRLTVMGRLTQTLYWKLDVNELPSNGVLDFEFPSLVAKGAEPPNYAIVMVDLCILHPADRSTKAFVVSNGLASILHLRNSADGCKK